LLVGERGCSAVIVIHRFEATRGMVVGVVHFYVTLARDSTGLVADHKALRVSIQNTRRP
jgi:hypothetical protein